MDRIEFETRELATDTIAEVAICARRGDRVAVVGSPGTGRSTAVARATRDLPALRLAYGSSDARAVRALRQAAATTPGGAELLEIYKQAGLRQALKHLDGIIGTQLVVIDDADRVLQATSDDTGWTDAIPGMTAPSDLLWADWIAQRSGPSVLVGTRRGVRDMTVIAHRHEDRWPITVRYAESGVLDWPTLARKLGSRLDTFWLAKAAAPLMSADSFNALVGEAPIDEILRELARVFRAGAGQQVLALDLIASLGGAPESVVRKVVALELPRRDRDPLAWLGSQDELLDGLRTSHLVSVSGPENGSDGEVLPAAALLEWGAVRPLSATRCAQLARRLLGTVNDPRELSPSSASVVLTAHDLAVSAGDHDLAFETATLHAHGLIQLARTLSRDDGNFDAAWRLYDRMESLVSAERVERDGSLRRVRSYILNYRAKNGILAGRTDPVHALADVTEATRLWPENARWHGQRVELLLELGRLTDAWSAVVEAETKVESHPQRARHLRVRPAAVCLQLGLVRSALELLQFGTTPWREDEEAKRIVLKLFQKAASGVTVPEIAADDARVVFRRPQVLQLRLRRGGIEPWSASLPDLGITRTGRHPIQTLDLLTTSVATEVESLIRRPTPWLAGDDAERKGELLAVVDALNSDIGLHHAAERWFVGRIEEGALVPMDNRVRHRIPLDDDAWSGPADPKGLWFGRARVDRAGFPVGPITEVKAAGSGRTLDELRETLAELWGEAS